MPDKHSADVIGRLFEVVQLVSTHPRQYTARKLADHLHVDVRTIRRYIHSLYDGGIRIESEPGGGYFTLQDAKSLPNPLTKLERAALEMMPWLLRGTFGNPQVASLVDIYHSAVAKILGRTGHRTTAPYGSKNSAVLPVIVDFDHADDVSDGGKFLDVLQAVQQSRTLQIEYQKVGTDATETRLIDPYHLVPRQNSLYLVGYCHLRKDYRTFKLRRMQSILCLDDTFTRDPNVSLVKILQSAWSIDQSGFEVDATLAFHPSAAGFVREDLESHQVMEEVITEGGEYVVRLRTHANHEFYRFLLQYGGNVRVLQPVELRRELALHASRMLEFYAVEASEKDG